MDSGTATDAARQVAAIVGQSLGAFHALKSFRLSWHVPAELTVEQAAGEIRSQITQQVQAWADQVFKVASKS
jgi:hypothetical protein